MSDAADMRKMYEARIYRDDEAKSPAKVDIEERDRRTHMMADFELVFIQHPRGRAVLAEIARILHFIGPAYTTEDLALQNAFKTILHRLGRWADDNKGADELIERLTGV